MEVQKSVRAQSASTMGRAATVTDAGQVQKDRTQTLSPKPAADDFRSGALPGRGDVSAPPTSARRVDPQLSDAAQRARTQAQFAHRPRHADGKQGGDAAANDDGVDAVSGAARYVPAGGTETALGARVPRTESHLDIPGNVTQTSGVGEGQPNAARDVRAVQQRLAELGHYDGPVNGEWSTDTEAGLRAFQTSHSADIGRIQQDNRDPRFRRTGYGAHTGLNTTSGVLTRNDATAQALHQAFPRLVGGQLRTETQAHDYYADQVRARGLPFEAGETHIVGVRGYQAGQVHDNAGVGERRGAFNDTMVVLSTDENGARRVREFRATLDPGNSPASDQNYLRQLSADQQIQYRLSNRQHERGGNRPVLFMQTGQGVLQPGQSRDDENLSTDERAVNVSSGRRVDGRGTLMMHSGGERGDNVNASSYGCQVPHADWYPSFYRAVEGAAQTTTSRVPYTILEGEQLTQGE